MIMITREMNSMMTMMRTGSASDNIAATVTSEMNPTATMEPNQTNDDERNGYNNIKVVLGNTIVATSNHDDEGIDNRRMYVYQSSMSFTC